MQTEPEVLTGSTEIICSTSTERIVSGLMPRWRRLQTKILFNQLAIDVVDNLNLWQLLNQEQVRTAAEQHNVVKVLGK